MAFDTSTKQSSSKLRQQDRWWEYLCFLVLMIAAFLLYAINLGGLPISNFNEGATAELANKILQAPPHSWRWIFPSVLGKSDFLQPPLFPDLVALSYRIGGFSPLTTRLPSALLGTISTAIIYGIGRELFKATLPSLLAGCVYLTFFPVVDLGRMGTIDMPLLCFEMFALWAVLRSRRDLRWTLIAGLGLSLVGLTHTSSLLPILALTILFLRWDTPRLLTCSYFYFGLILGIMPLIAWWVAQLYYYEPSLSFSAPLPYSIIATATTATSGLNWLLHRSFTHYLSRTLHYCSPWLIVSFYGLRLAWHYRIWGWAKFILIAGGVCSGFFLLAIASDSWYLLPIYPILSLAAGIQLYQLRNLPSYISYPRTWIVVFNCSAVVVFLMGLYGNLILEVNLGFLLGAIFGSVILTLIVASSLLARRDIQFINILIWGSYVSLLLLFVSPYWR